MKTITQGLKLHLVYNLIDEGILQEQLRFFQRDASLTHIKQGSIIQLTNC
jgi:hypothetical protein